MFCLLLFWIGFGVSIFQEVLPVRSCPYDDLSNDTPPRTQLRSDDEFEIR